MKHPWPWLALRFESRDDERRFVASTREARLRHFVLSGWFALPIYLAFLIVDWQISVGVFLLAAFLRVGLFAPVAVVMLLIGHFGRAWLRRLPAEVTEIAVGASAPLCALSLAGVLFLSPEMQSGPWAIFYHGGFVPILVYGNVVQRFRFRVALVSTLMVLAIHWASLWHAVSLPVELVVPMLTFIGAMAIYTLMTNFRLEREERQRFMQTQRARHLRRELHETQSRLEELARRDALTGSLNRRAFDDLLSEAWSRARRDQQPLAVLLIDVDHFKAFNDHYGHPAGDECLRHVASALDRCAVLSGGQVARFGGEEFALVLSGPAAWDAESLAEGLVAAVRGAELRHDRAPGVGQVTVSVGWARSLMDDRGSAADASAQAVVDRADAALYRAKRAGRNRASGGDGLAPQSSLAAAS